MLRLRRYWLTGPTMTDRDVTLIGEGKSEREQFEAWFRKEHGWYEEPLALSTGEFNAWQASRNAALEDAYRECMPFDSALNCPRACADRIRALATQKEA